MTTILEPALRAINPMEEENQRADSLRVIRPASLGRGNENLRSNDDGSNVWDFLHSRRLGPTQVCEAQKSRCGLGEALRGFDCTSRWSIHYLFQGASCPLSYLKHVLIELIPPKSHVLPAHPLHRAILRAPCTFPQPFT